MESIIRKKIHTLFIFDRELPEDEDYALSQAKGLELSSILLGQNIPFGRLVTDRAVAEASGSTEARRYGIITLLEDDPKWKPLFANRKLSETEEVELEEKVTQLAGQLRAIRSRCGSLQRIVLFGRAAQTMFDRALAKLEAMNPPAHEELASLECLRLPTLARASREQIESIKN
ncbi:hypothetical protein [Exiguobacterium flavidum]|uniref:hypothetical protein n=1 Tax=Exiguobacterium flavidum TaxID=2184695 RepID=UPI000DF85635|nr:hypothetical protein [Exiguobacterium flavidum]